MLDAIRTALTGLGAASQRVAASASNIANLQTAGSLEPEGPAPYAPRDVTQSALSNGGVSASVQTRANPFVPVFDPDSPFANADGVIGLPNIDLAEEAININLAEITYKANLKTLQAAADLAEETASLLDKKA